jgi:c-di-GMP-binding flagellar brake protein YcgR
MDERRRLDRKYLIVYSRVFERELGRMLGYLGDLSLSGAMIISEQPQIVNSVLPLRFDLPDLQLFKAGQLDISARVAHCEPDINPAFYNIGFQFLDVSPEEKTIIEKMMDAYEFRREIPNYPPPPSTLQNGE